MRTRGEYSSMDMNCKAETRVGLIKTQPKVFQSFSLRKHLGKALVSCHCFVDIIGIWKTGSRYVALYLGLGIKALVWLFPVTAPLDDKRVTVVSWA